MGRHSAPDGAEGRQAPVAPANPQRIRVVLVPRPRAAPPVEAGDPPDTDAPPTPAVPAWIALDEQQRIRRAWADAPGGFVRTGMRGPRTPPAGAIPVQPVVDRPAPPDGGWGPWPPEALRDHHPALVPAVGPTPAATRRRGPAVTALIAAIVVLLVGLGVVLARPDLAGPLLPSTGEVASVSGAQ